MANKPESKSEILKAEIIEVMKNLSLWDDQLYREIPKYWELYNDLVLFSSPSFEDNAWFCAGNELWGCICKIMNVNRIAVKGKIVKDKFRSPTTKLLFGKSSSVFYKDNKIIYCWNVEHNMFCAGNVTERHRIAKLNCEGEIIVDLFAGIGYFTLPFLVHARAQKVYACEWNPHAISSLRKNIKENKVEERCLVLEGDCRKVCPEGLANRVNLGLIPSSQIGWRTACIALLNSGGILYIHQNVVSKVNNEVNLEISCCEYCKSIEKNLDIERYFPTLPQIEVFYNKFLAHGRYQDFNFSLCWKKIEWLKFSIHLSHLLLSLFREVKNSDWIVSVIEINKVKSYAPHTHHLVYSVKCQPVCM